jgi:HEAT repeat protein
MAESTPLTLTPAEIERRVVAYLRGEPRASRQDWRRLGPLGMRWLYTRAVSPSEDKAAHRLRASALATLGQLAATSAVGPLIDVLAEPGLPLVVRCGALEGLGHARHQRAIPVLQAQAYSPEFKVRLYAATALGRIGSAGAKRALRDLAQRDPHGQVRRAASAELERLSKVEEKTDE